jgi:cytochrome b561
MLPLFIWFAIVGPPQAHAMGSWGFLVHSNLALLFVTICLLWTGMFLKKGMATTRTPKLPPQAQKVHWWMHRIIIWGLFLVALGGFLLGLTSSRLFKAGLWLPFAPPLGIPQLHEIIGTLHIIQFYGLAVLIAVHAVFHFWRHYFLKDNALRVMMPTVFHRFL